VSLYNKSDNSQKKKAGKIGEGEAGQERGGGPQGKETNRKFMDHPPPLTEKAPHRKEAGVEESAAQGEGFHRGAEGLVWGRNFN